jgi:hypothetical protein
MSHQEALRARDQEGTAASRVDGDARDAHALDGDLEVEQRRRAVARRVLDREPRHASLHAARHVVDEPLLVRRVAVLEVGIHG